MEKYPLDQLAQIKQKRLEEAEKVLRDKKEALAREQEKMVQLEKKRDEVKTHYKAKLSQLREKLDEGTSSTKITQMKQYLKLVVEDLAVEEKKVAAQALVVETAEKQGLQVMVFVMRLGLHLGEKGQGLTRRVAIQV